ncbi:MAG: glutamate--tRNA ligase [Gammaproteobacteria bacterium]
MSIITRFAPSPTGDLHIGSVRTALYCWLFAKKNHGKMILRIEDTDLERSTKESVNVILNGLTWLNLMWDEGPFFQTQRFARYTEIAEQMLTNNQAYYCSCSKERLENLRTKQLEAKQKPKYDGLCREKNLKKSPSASYVVRFKNPLTGYVEFDDLVRGKVKISNTELDDLILLRSDGSPTYNFTVVIDDFDMKITDIIRGEDHISNTPKQINLLTALDAPIPNYAHIPMILGADGSRLSKRHGASSVLEYEKMGILPHALINYLARLGWSHKDQEIFSIEELINFFDIKTVHKSAAIFNLDKLLWLNHHYIANGDINALIKPLKNQFLELGIDLDLEQNQNKADINKIINLQRKRVKTLQAMAIESTCFYQDHINITKEDLENLQNNLKNNQQITASLNALLVELKILTIWDATSIHTVLKNIAEKFNLKFSEIAIPLRIFTTGKNQTPSIDQVLELIGKQQVLTRITKGLNICVSEGL